jgi:hypothetical protein
MSRDNYSDISVSNSEEFEAALAGIVEAAIKNGIDVRGAWEFQTGGSTHNWELQISELAKTLDADEEETD